MTDKKIVQETKETQKEAVKETPEIKLSGSPTATKQEVKFGDYNANIIRDFDGKIDPFYLEQKDPDYAYRFIRDEQKNIATKTSNLLLQKGGWRICPREHLINKLGLDEKRDLAPDGLLRRGDQILCFMPKALFEEKEAFKKKQADAPVKNIQRMLDKGDDSVEISTGIHSTMKGLQTKKSLGM